MAVNLMDSSGKPLTITTVGDDSFNLVPGNGNEINFTGSNPDLYSLIFGRRNNSPYTAPSIYEFSRGVSRSSISCYNVYRSAPIISSYFNERGTVIESNWKITNSVSWGMSLSGIILISVCAMCNIGDSSKIFAQFLLDGVDIATHLSTNSAGYNGTANTVGFPFTPVLINNVSQGDHTLTLKYKAAYGRLDLAYSKLDVIIL